MNTTPGNNAHPFTLVVHVRYLAAGRPYVEQHAKSTDTLADLKARVLHHFGLTEGEVGGGRKEYFFSLDGDLQTNLSVTLGDLAHGKHQLDLTLIEQFIQG